MKPWGDLSSLETLFPEWESVDSMKAVSVRTEPCEGFAHHNVNVVSIAWM